MAQIAKMATTRTACSKVDGMSRFFSQLIPLVDKTTAVIEVGRQMTGKAKVNAPIAARVIAVVLPGVPTYTSPVAIIRAVSVYTIPKIRPASEKPNPLS